MTRKIRWTALALATSMAATAATPGRAAAQACSAGPLAAYLASAGLGCTIAQLRMKNFATTDMAADANNIFLNPFTLAGPPGFTWIGFNFTLKGAGPFEAAKLSFFSEGAPLYGLMANLNLTPGPLPGGTAVRSWLTGDGGRFRTEDLIYPNLAVIKKGCGQYGVAAESCVSGQTQWVGNALPDGDNGYNVDVSVFGQTDWTVAMLVDSSTVTPEPASMILLSTGLGGVGAFVRRRRKSAQQQA